MMDTSAGFIVPAIYRVHQTGVKPNAFNFAPYKFLSFARNNNVKQSIEFKTIF